MVTTFLSSLLGPSIAVENRRLRAASRQHCLDSMMRGESRSVTKEFLCEPTDCGRCVCVDQNIEDNVQDNEEIKK